MSSVDFDADVVLRIVISGNDNNQAVCSAIETSIQSPTCGEKLPFALLMGLSISITKEELSIFLDPVAAKVEAITLFCEKKCTTLDEARCYQYGKAALLQLCTEECAIEFQDLYNNMQLPSYSDAAPTVVVRVHDLEVLFTADDIARSPGPPTQSFSPVRAPSKTNKLASGSPGRPASPFRPGITEATYKRGMQLLQQHRVDAFTKGSLYVDYSKSGSPMGGKEGELGAGRQQQRHPETFETMAIPNCAVCLRRVRGLSNLSSGLTGCSDIPVCRSFTSDARLSFDELNCVRTADGFKGADWDEADCSVRCVPCHIYHTVTNSANERSLHGAGSSRGALKGSDGNMRKLGRCCACGMSENIWMCLQCGHTGCGRYTSQHAKAHHQEHPTHNLSLELATGRIWNYHTDTFCYHEDSYGSPQDPLYSASGALFSPLSAPIAPDSSRRLADPVSEAAERAGPASPPQCKKFMTPSFDPAQGGLSSFGPSGSVGRGSGVEGMAGLDGVTAGKITAMMGNYERLLEAQLQDQQLYFEKLLARETVRALELSYQPPQSGEKASSGGGSSAAALKKTKSQKNAARAALVAETTAGAEEKASIEPTLGYETCPIAAPFLTQSSAFQQAASELTDAEVLRGMENVEALKLEISAMEAEYRAVLEEVRAADDLVRQLKKENDALIRAQKGLREQEADWKQKTEQFRLKATEQVADLEQQIQDLSFYTRTRQQVQESPLRDEIAHGTVVTTTPKASSRPERDGGNSGTGKKGSFRKG